jgi:aspartate/tyrosine/aromatic aminotransferase
MFDRLSEAPPDAILGLTEAFRKDPNPNKINLSVGVYKDAAGNTPVLDVVKEAEGRLLAAETSKEYLGIAGDSEYARQVQQLLLGSEHEAIVGGRVATVQTPGGTGGLRVAADFIKRMFPEATVWLSQPTWPNHPSIFQAAGVPTATYPYFDPKTNSLDLDALLSALDHVPAGDVVLLHPCCHNPTGVDPSPGQWKQIADVVYGGPRLPLLDFAYQGFGTGLGEDARGVVEFCRPGRELLVCSSYSKNFGLYRERTGALSIVGATPEASRVALSQIKLCIRANYSNPPAHGAATVALVLGDPQSRRRWEDELTQMRDRINGMRRSFAERMQTHRTGWDFSFLTAQRGMFSFSGFSPEHVDRLREEYSIYLVRNGRINVAGMTPSNLDYLCASIAQVLSDS